MIYITVSAMCKRMFHEMKTKKIGKFCGSTLLFILISDTFFLFSFFGQKIPKDYIIISRYVLIALASVTIFLSNVGEPVISS